MQFVHLVVRGRVQGVGFRYFVARQAESLGVSGEVRNRADGGVEIHAQGDEAVLRDLLEAVRIGPPAARVSNIEEQWSDGSPRYTRFEIT